MVRKQKSQARYVKLKEPADVMAYVQTMVNNLRRKGLETDSEYIGKIIYLLNTWLSAYKTNLECIEVEKIKERLDKLDQEHNNVSK
jgi:hypothetical protein